MESMKSEVSSEKRDKLLVDVIQTFLSVTQVSK